MQRSKVTDDEVEKSSLQYGGRGGEDERLITKTPNNGILNTVADAATATATEIARLKTRPRCRVTEEEHIMLYLLIGFPPPTPAFSVNTTHRWFPGPSGQILSSRDWKTTSYTWWWSGGGGFHPPYRYSRRKPGCQPRWPRSVRRAPPVPARSPWSRLRPWWRTSPRWAGKSAPRLGREDK